MVNNEYGVRIKNMHAAELYEVNLGTREYFTYTDAMLNNSLFYYYMLDHGLHVHKGESTRDIICISFDFGSRSYSDEHKRLTKLRDAATGDNRERLNAAILRVEANKEKYCARSRDEIRRLFYEDGVSVTYNTKNKDGTIKSSDTIHYRMLFRTSAKAKLGQVIFINEKLHRTAYKWLTMGLKLPKHKAKIVEMSAYMPLTTSTIIDRIHIPVEDVLILEDQDSFFHTVADIVRAEDAKNGQKKCVVRREETDVKNTLWDGMGLIESSILPDYVNGMALLRNHFFKMCGFRTNIQLFLQDYCREHGIDYDTYQITDMFGVSHFAKNIKVITTENAIKWKKFANLMGKDPYGYWCHRINKDGSLWGVVKTDHPSKLGDQQQMSYQMVNSLPCTKSDIYEIASNSIKYVESLKVNNDLFEAFLHKNANEVNHYEMMADLYKHNRQFGDSTWFRYEKKKIISEYVRRLRTGKITVNGDNLTLCGNPYALLLYTVDEDWENDPTLRPEAGTIQCYTPRFEDGEYICAIRNPHNSPNNLAYLHNVYSSEMERYFQFSRNIIAVNCIHTDIQPRLNGADFDSDFIMSTNQPQMVAAAKKAYTEYPTIVNALNESGITYDNDMASYSAMDCTMAGSQLGIGWSSNLAQLAMTYYWTELAKPVDEQDADLIKELYDNFAILATLAQVIIDGCKRSYEVSGINEIKRIQRLPCMRRMKKSLVNGEVVETKCDFPVFMRYTRPIPYTKDGKELPQETVDANKDRLYGRIDATLVCPMNWLQEYLDKIQGASTRGTIPTADFFIKMDGKAHYRQFTKVVKIVEEYDNAIRSLQYANLNEDEYNDAVISRFNDAYAQLSKIKINNPVTINRLIETALSLRIKRGRSGKYTNNSKYTRQMLNLLYKTNKEKFLSNFMPENP